MAWVSKKVYAILQAAKEQGDEKASFVDDINSLSQNEVDKKVDAFFKGKSMSSFSDLMREEKPFYDPKEFMDEPVELDFPFSEDGGSEVEEPVAEEKPEEPKFKTKTGKLARAREQFEMRQNIPGNLVTGGGLNYIFGVRKLYTKEDIQEMAKKTGYLDPRIKNALEEGTEAWNNPTVIEEEGPNGEKIFTYNMGSEEANQQRQALGQKIKEDVIKEQQGKRQIRNDGIVYLVVGAAGAGKSTTFANKAVEELGAYELDGDMFKDKTPEALGTDRFNQEYGEKYGFTETRDLPYGVNRAPGVHNESTMLRDEMLEEITVGGATPNLVWPMVGAKESQVLPKLEKLREKGYKVSLINAYAAQEVAMQRNVGRYYKKVQNFDPIRLVPDFEYNKGNSSQINLTFEDMVTKYPDLIESWAVYDGSAQGKDAEFVDGSENWDNPERFIQRKKAK